MKQNSVYKLVKKVYLALIQFKSDILRKPLIPQIENSLNVLGGVNINQSIVCQLLARTALPAG